MSKQYASCAVITLLAITSASAQQATPPTPQQRELAATLNYAVRETVAPPAARAKLQSLRSDISTRKKSLIGNAARFEVGYTKALDLPLTSLAGLRRPANLPELARR